MSAVRHAKREEVMTDYCEVFKAKLVDLLGRDLSDKAKLVALAELAGIADKEELQRLLECGASTLRTARSALKNERSKSSAARNQALENEQKCSKSSETLEIKRSKSSALACATKELPSEVSYYSKVNHSPPTPSTRFDSLREGEVEAGHGVLVNCETIRHQAFTISLPGIQLNTLASGRTAEQIKSDCLGHALQWAAEIENGKRPDQVLPTKIANFLAASIMGAKSRDDIHGVRQAKASSNQTAGGKKPVNGGVAAELARIYGPEALVS